MKPKIRCAIYTRKSTEEGLEQEFNSLDAQYEACSAYIKSQKHEGWKLVSTKYDDGGISGGTIERPALQRLLADIDAGLIDMIVLYKIDRLTRSLADFTKIVERLDTKGASFVSVTQSFNTATSMGRLTLNMLLSFAQFEREVTGERIRDKIAASKAKGMWMGGVVPLGYDKNPDKNIRGLVINETEAKVIIGLFDLYEEYGCIAKTALKAEKLGYRAKCKQGAQQGVILSRGAIHKHLTNPIYIGKIKHTRKFADNSKNIEVKIYEGLHNAIIEQAQWDNVQQKLQEASAKKRGTHISNPHAALLKGKLFDETGDPLTPSHSNKKGRLYRYYISHHLLEKKDKNAWRLPASMIEKAITDLIKRDLPNKIHETSSNKDIIQNHYHLEQLKTQLQSLSQYGTLAMVKTINIDREEITIAVDQEELFNTLNMPYPKLKNETNIILKSAMLIKKRGVEQKLILNNSFEESDPILIKNLTMAHLWLNQIKSGKSTKEIAEQIGKSESFIRNRIPLALLSPKIQKAIMNGTQPQELTAGKIIKSKIPTNWQGQEQLYGFDV